MCSDGPDEYKFEPGASEGLDCVLRGCVVGGRVVALVVMDCVFVVAGPGASEGLDCVLSGCVVGGRVVALVVMDCVFVVAGVGVDEVADDSMTLGSMGAGVESVSGVTNTGSMGTGAESGSGVTNMPMSGSAFVSFSSACMNERISYLESWSRFI